MNHPATTPRQTSRCLFGLQENHNETLITRRLPRRSGLDTNHNETLITPRPSRRSGLRLGNHNETLITVRFGLDQNHNETVFADSPAWPRPELRDPAAVAPAG